MCFNKKKWYGVPTFTSSTYLIVTNEHICSCPILIDSLTSHLSVRSCCVATTSHEFSVCSFVSWINAIPS